MNSLMQFPFPAFYQACHADAARHRYGYGIWLRTSIRQAGS